MAPRPETEFWTEKVIATVRGRTSSGGPTSILDMFTGSGCIGIAVATHCPNAQVTLADKTDYISTPLPRRQAGLPPNAGFIKSDLFENIPEKFDFILANPPYVAEGAGVSGIMDSEPHDALYAGKDGLDVIKPFLNQVHQHLKPNGTIYMELSPEQKPVIEHFFVGHRMSHTIFCRDQYSRWRYLVAKF